MFVSKENQHFKVRNELIKSVDLHALSDQGIQQQGENETKMQINKSKSFWHFSCFLNFFFHLFLPSSKL